MLTAVVTIAGDSLVSVRLQTAPTEPPTTEATAADAEDGATAVDGTTAEAPATETHEELDEGPSPIMPEAKELLWGFGAFIVLCLAMRYAIYPRLRGGMTRRYDSIQQGYTDADALRASASGEVAAYQTALAGVKAEAAAVVESARQVLEGERQARLTEVNAGIAERKAAAAADTAAARQAAEAHVNEAAGSVASRIVELVTGNQPAYEAVRTAVDAATGAVVR